MSIFESIKHAIFGDHGPMGAFNHGAPAAQSQAAPAAPSAIGTPAPIGSAPVTPASPTPAAPEPVDVGAVLAEKAKASGQQLDYQHSIVDLLKLLGLDSSLQARSELATELGYTGAKDGSAEMNIWLHKAVMDQLVAGGGKVAGDVAHA